MRHMRRFLVRSLGARRNWRRETLARAGRAITDGEHIRIDRGLQCWLNDKLVDAVNLQPI